MINFICDLPQASLAYCFNQIDRSADGVIGEQELADGFVEDMDMKMGLAKLNAHEIVNKIDFNNSKSLDYSCKGLAI